MLLINHSRLKILPAILFVTTHASNMGPFNEKIQFTYQLVMKK